MSHGTVPFVANHVSERAVSIATDSYPATLAMMQAWPLSSTPTDRSTRCQWPGYHDAQLSPAAPQPACFNMGTTWRLAKEREPGPRSPGSVFIWLPKSGAV